jgi:nucleoside-diphosphate-sugar epimerase
MKESVLVTGGAGYVGSCVVKLLLAEETPVVVLDNFSFGGEALLALLGNPLLRVVHGDIRDANAVREAMFGASGIVHLAAIVGDPACAANPGLAEEINWTGANLVFDEALKSQSVSRFVFASTCSNYGKMKGDGFVCETSELTPVSLYAKLKVRFEERIMGEKTRPDFAATALRFSTACGISPRMRFDLTVNEFCRDMARKRPVEVFGGQFWRPYCHVEDLAAACALVLNSPKAKVRGEVFGVGDTDENYQKETLAKRILSRCPDAPVKFVHKTEDPRDYRVDFTKINKALGFKVTRRLDSTIDEIIGGIRQGLWQDPFAKRHANT